jgi:hypothetical protein
MRCVHRVCSSGARVCQCARVDGGEKQPLRGTCSRLCDRRLAALVRYAEAALLSMRLSLPLEVRARKSDALLIAIEYGVVLTHEHVAEDCSRETRGQ